MRLASKEKKRHWHGLSTFSVPGFVNLTLDSSSQVVIVCSSKVLGLDCDPLNKCRALWIDQFFATLLYCYLHQTTRHR